MTKVSDTIGRPKISARIILLWASDGLSNTCCVPVFGEEIEHDITELHCILKKIDCVVTGVSCKMGTDICNGLVQDWCNSFAKALELLSHPG